MNNEWTACWLQQGVNETQIGIHFSIFHISPLFSTSLRKTSNFKFWNWEWMQDYALADQSSTVDGMTLSTILVTLWREASLNAQYSDLIILLFFKLFSWYKFKHGIKHSFSPRIVLFTAFRNGLFARKVFVLKTERSVYVPPWGHIKGRDFLWESYITTLAIGRSFADLLESYSTEGLWHWWVEDYRE